jgi:hypothetical protein
MQNAATVLGALRERGRRGLPLNELYRQMFNPQLYLLAYGRIYANKGAMTPGATQETADSMSQAKIGRIIEAMRHERYRFAPVRRVHIPKKTGKTRPLGLPTWSDKLVGEVVRLLLEAYYEPVFSERSHGFRPGRGCHTALREIASTWTGTAWFIEGDIADCFGSLDHDLMIKILAERICDNRFLRLVRNMLTAGYLEDWKWGATLSGAPQGGVVTPPTQWAISVSTSHSATGGWNGHGVPLAVVDMSGSTFMSWLAVVRVAWSMLSGSTLPSGCWGTGFRWPRPPRCWLPGSVSRCARPAGMWIRQPGRAVCRCPGRAWCSPSSCPRYWLSVSGRTHASISPRSPPWWPAEFFARGRREPPRG